MRAALAAAAGGKTFREAVRLSWPATLTLLLHACYRVNDQFWIQDMGAPAQAALGVTSFMLIFNFALVTVVHTGTLARIARAFGAGDREGLSRSHHTAFKFGTLWFLAVAAAGYATTPIWVGMLGARGEVAALADDYLRVIYLGFPLLALKPVVDAMFIGMGNTVIPMILSGTSVALNFVLNPILIYGWGPVPAMGTGGAALATVLSRALGAGAGYLLLARYYSLHYPRRRPLDWLEVRRVVAIGLPMAFSTGGYALTFIAVLKTTVARFGETTQAGLGVAFNGVEAISYCGMMGPAIAVASMVGRRLGAGDTRGARESVRACMLLSVGIASVFTVAFLLAPRLLARVYSEDTQVLTQAAFYLWIVAWSQTATAAQSVFEQALAGAGHTLGMAVFNVIGNGARIPLCWLFAVQLDYGPKGAWWALNLTNYLKLGAIFLIYRSGRWHAGETPPQRAGAARPLATVATHSARPEAPDRSEGLSP